MKKKKHKSKLSPEVNRLFDGFFERANKITPISTLLEWPSRLDLEETSAELNKEMDRLMEDLRERKKRKKKEKSSKFRNTQPPTPSADGELASI